HFELRHPRRKDSRTDVLELLERLVVAARLEQRVRAGEGGVDTTALVGGDAVCEESRIDAEPLREPRDGLARGPRLAALDLADVLLREPVAREIGLGHPGCDPQLTEPLAEAKAGLCSRSALVLTGGGRVRHVRRSRKHASPNFNPSFQASPKKVMFPGKTSQVSLTQIT